jgi:hypothetical protein
LPIAAFVAAMFLSIAPTSAQTFAVSAAMTTPYGPITACPVLVKFAGTISASGIPPGLLPYGLNQFGWSGNGTLNPLIFPTGASTATVTRTGQRMLGKTGTYSDALVVYHFTQAKSGSMVLATTSASAVSFRLTCPSHGAPGSLSPALARGEGAVP